MNEAKDGGRIGRELRLLRQRRGLSGEAVAEQLGWSQAKVSRVESGRLGITMADLAALLTVLGAPAGTRTQLMALASVHESTTWVDGDPGMAPRQGEVGAIEALVTRIREHNPLLIPGLLQSPSFTAAMAAASGFTDVDDLVAARLERQAGLDAYNAPLFEAIVDARSLRRTPGGPRVLADQVRYLLDRIDRDNVEVRVLPESHDAEAFALGAFVLYEFRDPDVPPVVMCESQAADLYYSGQDAWSVYTSLWDRLLGACLGAAEGRQWLTDQLAHLENG